MPAVYQKMASHCSIKTPIFYSLSNMPGGVWKWEQKWAKSLANHRDILNLDSMTRIGFGQNELPPMAQPGLLERSRHAGDWQCGMSETEYKTHLSLWAIRPHPVAGNDLRSMTPATLAILTNRDVIA